MRIGDVEIHLIVDGLQRGDGGGMFGLVPKVMWEPKYPADEQNRLEMLVKSLLIVDGEHRIVVDTGYGDKLSERTRRIMGIEYSGRLPQLLPRHGVDPSQVDLVINTHLHGDHGGGNTTASGGRAVPTFPNATYVIQRGEWHDANHPNERTRATYLPENLLPLEESGQLRLIEGDTRITDHVRCLVTPGHTPNHQSILIESRGEKALFLGDLAPFTIHIERLAWVPAYDLEPMRTIDTRREIQRWASEEGVILIFQHDPRVDLGRLHPDSGRYRVEPLPAEGDS
ncbi:MAG: MBL fold metallo-hydrolase [Actinobacteria bacterium]|nr:MBL fold metallo-hydrolase [Actinomycetota bacterium]